MCYGAHEISRDHVTMTTTRCMSGLSFYRPQWVPRDDIKVEVYQSAIIVFLLMVSCLFQIRFSYIIIESIKIWEAPLHFVRNRSTWAHSKLVLKLKVSLQKHTRCLGTFFPFRLIKILNRLILFIYMNTHQNAFGAFENFPRVCLLACYTRTFPWLDYL